MQKLPNPIIIPHEPLYTKGSVAIVVLTPNDFMLKFPKIILNNNDNA